MEKYKQIELRRYDEMAALHLRSGLPHAVGAAAVPPEFRAPYTEFEQRIIELARTDAVVLDLGAGMGAFSLVARGENRILVAADISQAGLRVARARAEAASVPLHLVCVDGEHLPFRDGSVDVVTSAGVLYCMDLPVVAREVRRVLRSAGAWVIVDSLNENPLYRLNRWIGYLRRRRSLRAVRNVPTIAAIRGIRSDFGTVAITYYGVLTFLLPLLKTALGPVRAGDFLDAADRLLRPFHRWAFKVVVVAREPR